MTQPGWYPDPHDPDWLRYFDGYRWTGDRQPLNTEAPLAQPPQIRAEAPEVTGPGATSPYAEPYSFRPDLTPYPPIAEPEPDQHSYQPVGAYTPEIERTQYTPPPASRPRQIEHRPRSRRRLMLGLTLVLLASLVAGGWFLLHRHKDQTYTFGGRKINEPQAVLSQAEKALDVIVARRHGARDADTACYFALRAAPPKGTKKSDVASAVHCGPVLFVDGDPHKSYLSFPLSSSPASDNAVNLAPASAPVSSDPASRPSEFVLSRPDGQTAPPDGGLKVPAPPPATVNALVAAFLTGGQTLPPAPADAVMASLRAGVKLTKVGEVDRYGSGDEARATPPGGHLVGFAYQPVPGQIGNVSPNGSQLGLSVNHGPSRPLPAVGEGQVIVAAVPANGSADLVLNVDGMRQTINLPSGKPGAANLAVLRRNHIDAALSISKPMTIKVVRAGKPTNLAGQVTVTHAFIGYWTDDAQHHASNGSKALLWMDFRFKVPGDTSSTAVDAPLLTITPSGGTAVRATDLDPSDKVFAAFEVPATFTSGTVTISGSEPGSTAITVLTPMSFPVRMPG